MKVKAEFRAMLLQLMSTTDCLQITRQWCLLVVEFQILAISQTSAGICRCNPRLSLPPWMATCRAKILNIPPSSSQGSFSCSVLVLGQADS